MLRNPIGFHAKGLFEFNNKTLIKVSLSTFEQKYEECIKWMSFWFLFQFIGAIVGYAVFYIQFMQLYK